MEWTILDDAEAVARTARDRILEAARQAVADRGCFKLVLAGGRTPALTYRLLAESSADWQKWHIYFGDERCLPADHPDRNSLMAKRALTSKVPIPPGQIYPIPAELGSEPGAAAYTATIEEVLPFDMVLLGMGEDGHTASLFPGHLHPENELVVPVRDAPKPPPERISLSKEALGRCHSLLFLITGESKQDAVNHWRSGKQTLPVATIRCPVECEVLIDSPAFEGNRVV
ncbi:6-phosphogluconolactonase [Solemya velesiana gill symbiont]|uniref:6-phosphogluconolactonase n=1 Tax=Solemya velesiana gill symbiont TaxID=1918948 RepID=A0A1T2KTY9_9GAMM|nr:6-phosphogluconolactonase [Solemya velesiana gill symbiont]OOZ36317.1 6-phosphogluconolactonase [Solemya velesiana gill symbiont]